MSTTVSKDAKGRAARTFVQGLVIDLGVSAAALILAQAGAITTRAGLITFVITLSKTLATTGASYVMRRYVDGASVLAPNPPLSATDSAVGGAPATPVPTGGATGQTAPYTPAPENAIPTTSNA